MARSVSTVKQREYEELKRFFTHWLRCVEPIPLFAPDHPHHPLNVLASFERELGIPRALDGLKQAVNDVLEDCEDFSPEQIAEANASLTVAGAPTLTEMWRRRSRKYKAILRRGSLRNDTEFYLVNSIVSDTASEISEQDRETLGSMMASYESSRA